MKMKLLCERFVLRYTLRRAVQPCCTCLFDAVCWTLTQFGVTLTLDVFTV